MKTLFPSAACFSLLTASTSLFALIPSAARVSMERYVCLCYGCLCWQSSLHPDAPRFALEGDIMSSLLLILLRDNKSWQNHTGRQLGGVMPELPQRVICQQTPCPFCWDSPRSENSKRIWRHTQLVKSSPFTQRAGYKARLSFQSYLRCSAHVLHLKYTSAFPDLPNGAWPRRKAWAGQAQSAPKRNQSHFVHVQEANTAWGEWESLEKGLKGWSQHCEWSLSPGTQDGELLRSWRPLEPLGRGLCSEPSAEVKDLNKKFRRIITKLIGDRIVEWITKYVPSPQIFYFSSYKIYFCCWNSTWKFTLHSKEHKYSNLALFIL